MKILTFASVLNEYLSTELKKLIWRNNWKFGISTRTQEHGKAIKIKCDDI